MWPIRSDRSTRFSSWFDARRFSYLSLLFTILEFNTIMHASQISIKLIASACLFAGAFGVPLPGGGFDPTGFHAQNAMGQMGGRIEEFAPNAWKSGADGEFDGGFTAMDPISPHSGDAGMMHFPASKGQGAQRYPLLNALNAINPGSSSEAFSEDDWIPPLASTGTPEKAAHELQYDPTLDDILPDDDMGIADTATGTHFGDLGPQFGHQTRQSAFDGLDIEALLNQHPELLDMDDDSLPELPSLPSIPKLQGLDYGIAEGNMGRQAVPQHASPVGHHDPDFLSDFLRMQRERQQSLGLQDADLIDQFLHDGLPAVVRCIRAWLKRALVRMMECESEVMRRFLWTMMTGIRWVLFSANLK